MATDTEYLYNEYRQNLEGRRSKIIKELSDVVQKLDVIDPSARDGERNAPPPTYKLTSTNREIVYDIYTYGTRNRRDMIYLSVISNNIDLVYLGARALLPEPLITDGKIAHVPSTDGTRVRDEGFDILLDYIKINDDEVDIPKKLMTRFAASPDMTSDIMEELLRQTIENNPFRGITSDIPENSLHDTMLRKAVLDYCKGQDDNFTIGK